MQFIFTHENKIFTQDYANFFFTLSSKKLIRTTSSCGVNVACVIQQGAD